MNQSFQYLILLLIAILLTTSCGNVKYLECQSDKKRPRKKQFIQHWVFKNTIKFAKQKYKIQEDTDELYYDLESTILQPADRSILRGFRKWVYHTNDSVSVRYIFSKEQNQYVADTVYRKQGGIKPWLHKTVGAPPTVLDTSLAERTRQSMQELLRQRAYFNAKVSCDIRKKGHKAWITYNIETGMPTIIDEVDFISKDSAIQKILDAHIQETLFKPKKPISSALVLAEKERLQNLIRNNGYFDFNWRYIEVQADTTNVLKVAPEKKGLFQAPKQGEPRTNLYVEILPFSDTSITHPKYKIANVFIIPNEYVLLPYQKRVINKIPFYIVNRVVRERKKTLILKELSKLRATDKILDTIIAQNKSLSYKVERTIRKTKKVVLQDKNDILPTDEWIQTLLRKKYTREKDYYIREKVISDVLSIKNGDYYNKDAYDLSLKKINNLAIFRFPRIEYVPSASGGNYLDCMVRLRPNEKQNIGVNTELNTNTSTTVASLGIAGNISYRNKNVFKGAEIFELSAQLGIDFRLNPDSTDDASNLARWINLLDFNLAASFYFPKFMGLKFIEEGLKMENVRTKMSLGYRYLQQATDFQISSFYGQMGYTWSKGREHQFSWNPILVNFTLEPTLASSFETLLEQNNIALLNSLKAQYLIPSMDFSYTFNPPQMGNSKWFFKSYIEVAGNLFYLLDLIIDPQQPIQVFGVDYSQYFRTDFDIRYTYNITRRHSIATRLVLGVILPYGNSLQTEVPFVKRFTLGGPSSMRAWNLRYLGPGDQEAVSGAEFQMGDFKMEFNLEYRFMFNSWIRAAIFADMGNVWLLQSTTKAQGLPYQPPRTGVLSDQFYNQIAMGVGAGIRLDLSFFVFRIDLAIQLRDPQGYNLRDDGTVQYWNVEPFIFPTRHKFVIAIGYPF